MLSTFDSTKQPLSAILGGAKEGKAQLPDFQRGWVWDDDHIRDLLASISRSFPIGAVMMLEAGGQQVQFKPRPIEGAKFDGVAPELLILDGQQRITSLFQSLMAGEPVATRDAKGKPVTRWYYIDIEDALNPTVDREDAIRSVPADKIVRTNFGRDIELDLSTAEKEYQAKLFPLAKVFDRYDWRSGFNSFWQYAPEMIALWDRFEGEVIRAFEHFQLPVIELKKETPKEAVCLVFEKVNTGGVSLTVFELLTATFAASGFQLRPDWEARKSRFEEVPVLKDVASTDFLQSVTLVTTNEARQRATATEGAAIPAVTCKRRDVLKLTAEDYRTWADKIEEGYRRAARFLHREHVFDPKFLPYSTQLVPLAALFTILGDRAGDQGVHSKLVRWFWCGVFGELYGSATETRFARDVVDVLTWLDGGPEPRTIADANFAPERLLTLRTRNSAAYRGLYVLLLREGAKDFRTGEEGTHQTYFDEAIDIHHLFPKKWCKDRDIEAGIYDSIVNKTPLTARTNRIIGGNAPSEYLSSLERNYEVASRELDDNLRSHLIDATLMREDRFEAFFRQRSEHLLDAIANAMGKQLIDDATEGWLPDISYDEVEPEPELPDT